MYQNTKTARLNYRLPAVHKWAATTVLNDHRDIYQYSKVYSCWPNCKIWMGSPPLVTLALIFAHALIWLISFIFSFIKCHSWHSQLYNQSSQLGNGDNGYENCNSYLWSFSINRICEPGLQEFIWDPYQTSSVWRYFTYSFNSINLLQMLVNLLVYIFIGVPFEMVFGTGRAAILLLIVSGLGSFASSIFMKDGFIVGGSCLLQFYLCSQIFSRIWKSTNQGKGRGSKTLGWIFWSNFLMTSICILDFLLNYTFYMKTKKEPKSNVTKIKLSYIPTISGMIAGFINGSIIMTGYRRSPLKQICLETSFYVICFGFMLICTILRVIPWGVRYPSCRLDYPSDRCAPLTCRPAGTNQAV